jgi:hypothetical protein
MLTKYNSEAEFNAQTEIIKNDKQYDRCYVDERPTSYPCIVCYNSESDYYGDRLITTIDIIYPEDFS